MILPGPNVQIFRDIIEGYFDAYKNKDLDRVLKFFHPDIPVMIWGTGKDECSLTLDQLKDQLERDWKQLDTIDYYINPVACNIGYNMAWSFITCHSIFTIAGEKVEYPLLRVSFVFKQKDSSWYIAHMHWSVTDNQQDDEQSYQRIPLNAASTSMI
ncbi:MAG: hypothetical protein CMF50_01260 [Legionellales bacterium]|nr:hypothetical protein [Legionellales bacterium]|tara:strand:- start:950 stop:1417 length:468 start_codon:yes stop_codon:yes gene_type:complete